MLGVSSVYLPHMFSDHNNISLTLTFFSLLFHKYENPLGSNFFSMNITIYDLKDHLSSIISFDEENLISLLTNSKICHSVSNNEPVLGVHWKRGEIENN